MMMMTNDNKDETLIYWTVCVVNIIILKVIVGLGKLASASASFNITAFHFRKNLSIGYIAKQYISYC